MSSGPPAAPYTIPGLGAFSSKDWTPDQWLQIEALVNLLQGGYAQLAKPQNALVDANGNVVTSALGNVVPGLPGLSGLIELLAHKDAASGYAGLDSGARLKLSEWPFQMGGLRWHDTAGTITVDGTWGTQAVTMGFQSGTTAGKYIVTLPSALGDSNWIAVGIARLAADAAVVTLDEASVLHSTTQLGIKVFDHTFALARPAECLLFWGGNHA